MYKKVRSFILLLLSTLNSFLGDIPSIQIPHAKIQIRRIPQPSQIRHHKPRRHVINPIVIIRQPDGHSCLQRDIHQGQHGLAQAEEERHPEEIGSELDGIETLRVMRDMADERGRRREAGGGGAIASIAHGAV